MFDRYLTPTGLLSRKQPQDVKNQWYIGRFKLVHGSKYDYSKTVYTTSKTEVVILCKEHGEFLQTPNHHLQGDGCPKCQGNQRLQVKQFIQAAQLVHGDLYDYSLSNYTNAHQPVDIVCKTHGVFSKSPNNHIQGQQGCPQCSLVQQNTLYILKCKVTGLIKIGVTCNLQGRLLGIGGSMEILHYYQINNPRYYEKILHKKYKKFNVINRTVKTGFTEFFNLTNQQVEEIDQYVRSI